MNIVAFSSTFSSSNDIALKNLLLWFITKGHDCQVVTGDDHDFIENLPHTLPIHNIERAKWIDWVEYADLVIVQGSWCKEVATLTKSLNKPAIHYVHDVGYLNQFKGYEVDLALFDSYSLMRNNSNLSLKSYVAYPRLCVEDHKVESSSEYVTLFDLSKASGSEMFYWLAEKFPDVEFLGVLGNSADQFVRMLPNVTVMSCSDIRVALAKSKLVLSPSALMLGIVEGACSGIPSITLGTQAAREALRGVGIYCEGLTTKEWEEALRKALSEFEGHHGHKGKDQITEQAQIREIQTEIQLEGLERIFHQLISPYATKMHFVASEKHYTDHLLPLYHSIPASYRGVFHCPKSLEAYITEHGALCSTSKDSLNNFGIPELSFAIVASHYDQKDLNMDLLRIEHGSGQVYDMSLPSFCNSDTHKTLHTYLALNQACADHSKAPNKPIIGSPKVNLYRKFMDLNKPIKNPLPTITFSFHTHTEGTIPEFHETFSYWKESMAQFIKENTGKYQFYGHSHPRFKEPIEFFKELNIEFLPDFNEVVILSDAYVCDNSSTIFEFASTGKPVALLNHPKYREDINLGLRFWDYADIGTQINKPEEIDNIHNCWNYTKTHKVKIKHYNKAIYPQIDSQKTILFNIARSKHTQDFPLQYFVINKTFHSQNKLYQAGEIVKTQDLSKYGDLVTKKTLNYDLNLKEQPFHYKESSLFKRDDLSILEMMKLIMITQMEN